MKRKAILELTGHKAITEEIELDAVIREDLAAIALKYPGVFGKAEENETWANYLVHNTLDQANSTIKLICKDKVGLSLDINMPWNQAEAEFAKIEGTPNIKINLTGVVG